MGIVLGVHVLHDEDLLGRGAAFSSNEKCSEEGVGSGRYLSNEDSWRGVRVKYGRLEEGQVY